MMRDLYSLVFTHREKTSFFNCKEAPVDHSDFAFELEMIVGAMADQNK